MCLYLHTRKIRTMRYLSIQHIKDTDKRLFLSFAVNEYFSHRVGFCVSSADCLPLRLYISVRKFVNSLRLRHARLLSYLNMVT